MKKETQGEEEVGKETKEGIIEEVQEEVVQIEEAQEGVLKEEIQEEEVMIE